MASGSEPYTNRGLQVYDYLVHNFSNKYIWRCPTESVLIPWFAANAGPRHMDIGVGTGFFPGTHREREALVDRNWPEKLMLVDLNPRCLERAAKRVGVPDRTACQQADVMQPMILRPGASSPEQQPIFDSISLMYIIHCLPPPTKDKARLFANVKPYLTPEGTLFGATVLGKGVEHNWLGRLQMWNMNRLEYFGNLDDGREEFEEALEANFHEVETTVVGVVLLFRAKIPKFM